MQPGGSDRLVRFFASFRSTSFSWIACHITATASTLGSNLPSSFLISMWLDGGGLPAALAYFLACAFSLCESIPFLCVVTPVLSAAARPSNEKGTPTATILTVSTPWGPCAFPDVWGRPHTEPNVAGCVKKKEVRELKWSRRPSEANFITRVNVTGGGGREVGRHP